MPDLEALIHRYMEEVWHRRNPDAADAFLTADFRRHVGTGMEPLDREGQKALLRSFQSAFPDAEIALEDVLVDRDRMAFRSTLRGTHCGFFRGIPPTQRRVTVRLLDFVRVEQGRFAEQWGGPDLLDMLRQLGSEVSAE